jgi:rod shape-determining protein MreD
MNPYLLVLGLGLAALIQVAFLPVLAIAGVGPSLMLVLVVGWALLRDRRSALLWALIGGLWLDLLSGGLFGLQTISLLAVAYVTSLGGGTIFRAHLVLPIIMTLVGTIVYTLVPLSVYLVIGRELPPASLLLRLLAIEMAYNAVLMLLVFPLLSLLNRVTGRERLPLE